MTLTVFLRVGTAPVLLLLNMVMAELPVTSMVEVGAPKVVFHTPIASVPALSSVDFHVLLPA